MKQEQTIDAFVEKLIEEKKFENVDADVLEQIKSDLTERVEDRINATILENIPKEKLEDFSALLDGTSDEAIQEFCHSNIVDLDEKIATALVRFRDIYLNA